MSGGQPRIRAWTRIVQSDGSQICTNDPELWFSEENPDIVEAKKACATCPFLNECRLEGLVDMPMGVWGGLSYEGRRRMGGQKREEEIARLRSLVQPAHSPALAGIEGS